MTDIEQYEFDRQGFLILQDFLTEDEVSQLRPVIDELEQHAIDHYQLEPRNSRKPHYHFNPERGYYAAGSHEHSKTLIIEDFFNFHPAFDFLVNHPKTMGYIQRIVKEKIGINNSELRVRYPNNHTGAHMGGLGSQKHRYTINTKGIDCMMVRFVYFVQDVSNAEGAFCAVPGSHKSAFRPPYSCPIDEEPGMVGLEVKTGDAILFTENLRHGGFTNHSNQTRKTLHVGYGPFWMMSQNIATMDEPQYIKPETWARYDQGQRELFQPWLRQGSEYQ
jgi:hypothetical protein